MLQVPETASRSSTDTAHVEDVRLVDAADEAAEKVDEPREGRGTGIGRRRPIRTYYGPGNKLFWPVGPLGAGPLQGPTSTTRIAPAIFVSETVIGDAARSSRLSSGATSEE